MFFNSIAFALFLPVVFFLYWFVANKKLHHQNMLLLLASYFFYSCWDYRFLFLLIFSTLLDYFAGLQMGRSTAQKSRKIWLWIAVIINLGFLAVFKYYNFFAAEFAATLGYAGIKAHFFTLSVILPVGISFYTFHGLSYVIDIYHERIIPEKNFVNYAVFVSFFPLLVAGPIERATHLLPQIKKERKFNYTVAADGLKQILWGLFKKIVIADSCAVYANMIFDNSSGYGGSTLALGAVFFAFQIYCDFSGYSDIALGTARLFGIDLLRNFAFPYFSRDIAEFWRRWHISLSTWFRDYVYIPLGGSRGGIWQRIKNTFIIFLLSGFWHGANWTFVAWGALHAAFFLPLLLLKRNRSNLEIVAKGKYLPSFRETIAMIVTFSMTVFAWIFFRAKDIGHAFSYVGKIFSRSLFTLPQELPKTVFVLLLILIALEWIGREEQYAIARIGFNWHPVLRWSFYYCISFFIFFFVGSEQPFIYFQF